MWLDPTTKTITYDLEPQLRERVRSSVPGAIGLTNGFIAAPATLHNLQILRWIGLAVPPPMESTYDWPIRKPFKPFIAQKVTANFLAVHPRAFVLSDMGTGKTLAALWASDFVLSHNPGTRCLIVAPLSTLQRVWADAIFQNFLGRRRCVVLHGSAEKRRRLLALDADFYIINHDGVNVLRNEIATRPDLRMVIIDEASAYRDSRTKRSKLARTLLGPRSYLWLMTGTPTPNGPTDAYGLAKLVNNAFGETYTSYKSRVMVQLSQFKWVPKPGSHLAAHRLLQPSIRYHISDCLDLPPCTTQTRDVELSPEQAKAYKEMKAQAVIMLKEGHVSAVNEGVVRLKLIQIACGAVYGTMEAPRAGHNLSDQRVVHRVDCAPRIAALREVMAECNEKIIIFAPLTSVLTLLNAELREFTRAVINGEVSQKQRSELFRSFQDDEKPRVLIADPATMAHGLTLTAASTIIWFAPTDRTELYLQANKRIDRPGQTKTTTIVHLAASPVEREIYRRLAANESLQGLILQLAKGGENGNSN